MKFVGTAHTANYYFEVTNLAYLPSKVPAATSHAKDLREGGMLLQLKKHMFMK
ncbi:hypothetical protein QQ054_35360 [Oscillatoria amoena NRMC-F 0135]|nr:hypothetical protein [Oscillatoria amoena NRMC-F 0135]